MKRSVRVTLGMLLTALLGFAIYYFSIRRDEKYLQMLMPARMILALADANAKTISLAFQKNPAGKWVLVASAVNFSNQQLEVQYPLIPGPIETIFPSSAIRKDFKIDRTPGTPAEQFNDLLRLARANPNSNFPLNPKSYREIDAQNPNNIFYQVDNRGLSLPVPLPSRSLQINPCPPATQW